MAIRQGGSVITNGEQTINVADLPAAVTANDDGGWIVFKLPANATLAATTAYTVALKTSSSAQVSAFRDSTAANWCRMIVTTATGTPTTGDDMYVAGEHTGAGTGNDLTVTMDSTAATDYGSAPTAANSLLTPGVSVSARGIMTFGTTAATNYILRLSNSCIVYLGGVLNIGTTGTPMPRDSTAVLEFDGATDGDYGLIVHGSCVAQGLSRSSGKNIFKTILTADAAANATSLTVADDTGWLDNDQIAISGTSSTSTHREIGALNGAAGASSLTVDGFAGTGGGVLNAHSGTSPTRAVIILLTRNVRIRSVTSTVMAYVHFGRQSSVDWDWVEIYYVGTGAAAPKRGVEIQSANSVNVQFCSLHDCENGGMRVDDANATGVVWSNNVHWALNTANNSATAGFTINAASASGTALTSDGCVVIGQGRAGNIDVGNVNITNLRVANTQDPLGIMANGGNFSGTLNGLEVHGCNNVGVDFVRNVAPNTLQITGTVSNITVWRCLTHGFQPNNISGGLIDTITTFGNTTSNVNITGSMHGLTLKSLTMNSDSSFASGSNMRFNSIGVGCNLTLVDGVFSGTLAPTDNADMSFQRANAHVDITCINCTFGSSLEITGQTNLVAIAESFATVRSQKHDGSAGSHKTWFGSGLASIDTSIFRTASPSQRLAPTSATLKLPSAPRRDGFRFAVASGATATVSVYVRKSATGSGDAASYNGNQPRLILRRAPAIGQAADAVLATAAGAAGSFEQLTATVPPSGSATDNGVYECYVDCDGTTGWVNVDDWSVT